MDRRPFKICIVSVHTYPVINPGASGQFGGMETRSWCFARELAKIPGVEVSFVVTHRTAPRISVVDHVTVREVTSRIDWYHQDISSARQELRKRGRTAWPQIVVLAGKLFAWAVTRPFRLSHHLRWETPSPWLTDLNADIYVGFGLNSQSVWTAISAESINRPFVLCLTSDFDVDPRLMSDPAFVNQYGASSKIAQKLFRTAKGVVAQNVLQNEETNRIWQIESEQIANPLDLATWDKDMMSELPTGISGEPFVLWVGRADRFHKRPLEMLSAITANPQIKFVMVLGLADDDVYAELTAAHCPNLILLSTVSVRQMAALMYASTLFATTSSAVFEGIPNVLLQASASSKPIVSLEAAAEWLETSGAGVCVRGDRDAFVKTISRFVRERETKEIRSYAEAGRTYIEREHNAVQQSAKLLVYLRDIAARSENGNQ